MSYEESQSYATVDRDTSPMDVALRRANEAEAQLGEGIHALAVRLEAVLQPESPHTDGEARLVPAEMPRGRFTNALDSHAEALLRHGQRLGELIARLEI